MKRLFCNAKCKIDSFVALIVSTIAIPVYAETPTMGALIDDNLDVSSVTTTAVSIAGSAIGLAALIKAARVGKRLIGAL